MKKLLILSGKGGTGKTTVSSAFIRFSNAKAIADCDVDAPNLHIIAQTEGTPQKSDFLGSKKADIDSSLCTSCGVCTQYCRFDAIHNENGCMKVNKLLCEGCGVCCYVCPENASQLLDDVSGELELYSGNTIFSTATLKMGRGNSGKLVANVKRNLQKEAKDVPFAIIDGSPGIGCPVISSINGVNMVLIVTEPSMSGISDLKRLLGIAEKFSVPVTVCINKYDSNPKISSEIETYCLLNEIPFSGKIPYDKTVLSAVNSGKNIADFECPAKDALQRCYIRTMIVFDNIGCDGGCVTCTGDCSD